MHPRPLIMRCGAFGDIVLLTVLIRQLALRFGQPVDIVSSGPWTQPLLAMQQGVGELYLVRSRKTPYYLSGSQRALVRILRRRGAGPTWFCDPGTGLDLLRRAGIPQGLICDARDLPPVAAEHYVERWARFANETPPALGTAAPATVAAPARRAATLSITPEARAAVDAWLATHGLNQRPLVLIQAGNKRTMRGFFRRRGTNTKYWPEARWAEVVRGVKAARPDHCIALLGVPAEFELNREIAARAGVPDVYNLSRELPVQRLLPLLERATSLISVDTGPAHAAAALGCPTVALFGVSDPVLYRPGGIDTPAVSLTGIVQGKADILGIEPRQVLGAWHSFAARPTAP